MPSTEKCNVYAFYKIKPKRANTPLGDVQIQTPDNTLITKLSKTGR